MKEHKYTNRLINETSPYLLQHAHNPVDWYPWGEEALKLSKQLDKPILLSIGYSSCHWCHVMERESFEDERTANIMNENFICIKVDREERPDIDEVYMNAVQVITGSGGWPMTVFLTPDLKPFYAGTYFPPKDYYGKPSFTKILIAVSRYYKDNRNQAEDYSDQVVSVLQKMAEPNVAKEGIDKDILDKVYTDLVMTYDNKNGGFGTAPKFPQAMSLSFLMRYFKQTGTSSAMKIVKHSLNSMANGGIYDHIGGGFHRYSVDEKWVTPHFEKMLYDNALLSKSYLEAYQITKEELYKNIASETLDYVLREMYHPDGGFYSSQDADSEGIEGKYYLWKYEEIEQILGDDAKAFIDYYAITSEGNFEQNQNIIYIPDSSKKMDNELLKNCKLKLFNERNKRIKPIIDDKIITSWNALMISSMALGYQILKNESYLRSAIQTADFFINHLDSDGILFRTYKNTQGKIKAYSEDYAFFINALIDLYESTFDETWLQKALKLNSILIDEFWDEKNGGLFYIGKNHEKLIANPKPAYDSVIPSANSISALNFLRLTEFIGDKSLINMAEKIFFAFQDQIKEFSTGFSQMVSAIDFYLNKATEIVIIGKKEDEKVKSAIQYIYDNYIPNRVLVFCDPSKNLSNFEANMPLLSGRIDSQTDLRIYVCKDFTCKRSITDINELNEDYLFK